jgi:hypothetical protein
MSPDTIPSEMTGSTPIYLSCSPDELLRVEILAWTQGDDQAGLGIPPRLQSIEAVRQSAEQVCELALRIYIPLDVERFRDVFTRAWSAGYCSRAGLIVTEKRQAPESPIH